MPAMTTPPLSSENVSALIDHILKTKDPATVGLRRILKNKIEADQDFPLKTDVPEDFGSEKSGRRLFSESEQRLLTLEKQVQDLQMEKEAQKKKAEKAVQAAYEKGLKDGAAKGFKDGEKKAADDYAKRLVAMEQRLVSMLKEVTAAKDSLFVDTRRQLLDLALLIARKIINQELSADPEIVLSVIKKTFSYIANHQQVVVRVAPEDFETVSQKKDFWTSLAQRLDGLKIEKDSRVAPGGCVIETSSGVADGRISVQLDELKEVIEKTWSECTSASAADDRSKSSSGSAANTPPAAR
jgi:flagellar assembly protein FliH